MLEKQISLSLRAAVESFLMSSPKTFSISITECYFYLSLNDQRFKAAVERCPWALPGHRICWAQPYIRAYSIPTYRCAALPTPGGQPRLQTHQNTTFKRLHVISINSWTLRNQQSTLSSETDFERGRLGERERVGSKTHTLSFIPSHYIPES